MRDDFSHLLTERERIHSWDHYHNYRNVKGPKGLSDDEVGGRESMRRRYNHGYDRKSFNENLNPLYGWLRSCVGKKWDKCYSELRQKFDTRSTINAHILQHLFDAIEVNTFVDEHGRSMARPGRFSGGNVPISETSKDYYVCPKSGLVRATKKKSYRQVQRQKRKAEEAERHKVERWLDKDNVLRLIDGIWYHLEVRDSPLLSFTYVRPLGKTSFECGSWGKKVAKRWEDLNQAERKEHGQRALDGEPAVDVLTGRKCYRYEEARGIGARHRPIVQAHGEARYHATKKQASTKQLRQAGIN